MRSVGEDASAVRADETEIWRRKCQVVRKAVMGGAPWEFDQSYSRCGGRRALAPAPGPIRRRASFYESPMAARLRA